MNIFNSFFTNNNSSTKSDTTISSKTFNLNTFTKISLYSSFNVHVSQGDKQSVKATGTTRLMNLLKIEVIDDYCEIFTTDKRFNMYNNEKVDIHITVPNIIELTINGSGNIATKTFKLDNIKLDVKGSGNIKASLMVNDSITAKIGGSGNIKIKGQCNLFNATVIGSGNIKTVELVATQANCSVIGSGNIKISVTDMFYGSVTGSGNIKYKGKPSVFKKSVTGSGSIKRM